MSFIENAKTYTGRDLETHLLPPDAQRPVGPRPGRCASSTTCPHRRPCSCGNDRATSSNSTPPQLDGRRSRPKTPKDDRHVERSRPNWAIRPADYFSMIYELITNRADVNMDDLTGTELEQAETELFKRAIAEKPPRDDVDRATRRRARARSTPRSTDSSNASTNCSSRTRSRQRRPTPRPTSKRPQRPSISSTPHGPKPPKS